MSTSVWHVIESLDALVAPPSLK